MSLSTLNPVQPQVSARNVARALSPGMQYNAANTTKPTNDNPPPPPGADYDWGALKKAIAAGVIKVGVDKFALKDGGELMSQDSLKRGGVQAVASFMACKVREMVQNAMPDKALSNMSAGTLDSLVAGALYVVIAKYGLGRDEKVLKSFLTSALSDFGAKMIYDTKK